MIKFYCVIETFVYGETHYWAAGKNASDKWVRDHKEAVQFATIDSAIRVMNTLDLANGHAKVTEIDSRDKPYHHGEIK